MEEIQVRFCHDCGCEEGEIHGFGCDVERCPFCGSQLIGCRCCYEKLGVDPNKEPVYSQGLSNNDEKKWIAMLQKKGRIPFIMYPNLCVRCGELWPPMFSVPDKEWEKYIAPTKRREMLCKPCYNYIKHRIDKYEK